MACRRCRGQIPLAKAGMQPLAINVTEQPEHDNENENGGDATTAKFPRRRSGEKSA